jgi:serine/threonine-protein kinase
VAPGEYNLLDTYAFGVIAFELLAGELPYQGDNAMKIMVQHVSAPVPELRERAAVPAKLSELVGQLMRKDARERPESMEAVAGQLRAIRSAQGKPSSDAPLHVLIVDDTPDIAKLMGMYVKMVAPNADMVFAPNAKSALDAIRKRTPNLMLLDLMMPDMSGVELFMYLRGARLCDDCTVVAVSAGASDADLTLLHELGVSYFVAKGPDLRPRLTAIVRGVTGAQKSAKPPSSSSRPPVSRQP